MSKKKRRNLRRQNTQEPTEAPSQSQLVTTDSGTYEFINGGDVIRKANGNSHDVVKTRISDLIFGQILPHEIVSLIPLITDLYKEIGFTEAAETPMPYIREINRELATNPYSIIYACVDSDMKPHGYMWFRVDRNPKGEHFVTIEHDYIIPEHRGTLTEARIHDRLISYAVEIGERVDCKYVNTSVRSKKLMESRKKLGFVPVEMKMTFTGSAQDFKNRNPRFQRYGYYENKEESMKEV
ncbi:MAG: hypothetical protein C4555_03255 [Dehalococcoidia bacterium]|nr:MAG: hypothetical protein C4555_03255 [Dehalococcoidia bacterium]